MKSRLLGWILGGILLHCLSSPLLGQISLSGGKGLLRVTSAKPVRSGDLYINLFGSAYFEKINNALSKEYHLTLSTNYGLTNFLELDIRFVLYQDDQRHIWGPIGDTEMGIKLGFPIDTHKILFFGLRSYLILPTAPNHNVEFEPFSADHVGWTNIVCSTIDFTEPIHYPLKLYFNFGYLDHNLQDNLFAAKIDQIFLGAGIKFPIKSTILFWEFTTEQFYNRPELSFRQNSMRSSQGIVFIGPFNTIVNLSCDVNLSKPTPTTFFYPKRLANWKIWFGVTNYVSLRRYFSKISEKRRREKELQEELKKQERIRAERKKAIEEMKKMQQILKKQPENGKEK